MRIDIEDIARRLVIGRKRDGRGVYDPKVKQEVVEISQRPGISMARLARDCGINANLLSTWIRQARRSPGESLATQALVEPDAFIALPVTSTICEAAVEAPVAVTLRGLQIGLPNGITLSVQDIEAATLADLIETLGRLRCSVSTKG